LVLSLALVLLFSIVLLVQHGNFISKEETIRQINVKIESTQAVISNISARINEESDPVQICYTAARDLDMVPTESAQAIYLSALSTRPNQEPIAIRASND
jgi:cell division protein FtsL